MPQISYLECSRCHTQLDASTSQTVCTQCAGALYVRCDLSAAKGTAVRDSIGTSNPERPSPGMWRYSAVLPDIEPVTLGEGWTPMLPSRRYADVYLKEEGANPTGTFKARGLSLAMTMARHYGIKKIAVPSAGNAGGAAAAYAAAAGIEAHIFMPKDVPLANQGRVPGLRREDDAGRRTHLRLRPASSTSASSRKAGSTYPRLRSHFASKARRPWATS